MTPSFPRKAPARCSEQSFTPKTEKDRDQNEEQANAILADLEGAPFVVGSVKKGSGKRRWRLLYHLHPAAGGLPPSGLPGPADLKAAQELYEGVDVEGMGPHHGLITYMRTDSLRISDEARAEAETFILEKYGKQYLPQTRRVYKTKSSAQDAHEAIRRLCPL